MYPNCQHDNVVDSRSGVYFAANIYPNATPDEAVNVQTCPLHIGGNYGTKCQGQNVCRACPSESRSKFVLPRPTLGIGHGRAVAKASFDSYLGRHEKREQEALHINPHPDIAHHRNSGHFGSSGAQRLTYAHEGIETLANRTKHGAFSWLARSALALRPRKRIVRRRRGIVSVRTCYASR
jgi:hypothetical protein